MLAIEVSDLTKTYTNYTAVDHLTFEIPKGQIFGLLGPNGAGKTTTINMLCGLNKASSGQVKIMGYHLDQELKSIRKILGVVPQETALYDHMTGRENLEFHAALYGIRRQESKKKIDGILDLVGLEKRQKTKVGAYSGGMKRRLALGRALLSEPKLLFLDEPSLGVDVQSRMAIWNHILELKERGITVLVTTNYMEEADYLAEQIAIIDQGKLVTIGSPDELKAMVGDQVIEIGTENFTQEAKDKLMQLEYIEKVNQSNDKIYLTVKEGQKTIIPVVDIFKDLGLPISSFALKKVSLNEAFIELTGKKLRD